MKAIDISILLIVFFASSCSKDANVDPLLPDEQISLTGWIFFLNHDGHSTITFPNMQENVWKKGVTWYDWDISLDGEHILEMQDGRDDGKLDQVKLTYRRFQDDAVMKQFYYAPLRGGTIFISGRLSPDKSLFCITPTFEEGLVLISPQEEKVIAHLEDINGKKLPRNTSFCWMPDNSIVVAWENAILRFQSPYKGGELVAELETSDFSHLVANRQGTKLAMILAKHVWILDLASGEMYQVTDSEGMEASPAFSPDGRHIILGADVREVGVPGSVPSYQSYLKVVPVDGKTYNVDQDGEGVIPVIAAGKTSPEPLKGTVIWTE